MLSAHGRVECFETCCQCRNGLYLVCKSLDTTLPLHLLYRSKYIYPSVRKVHVETITLLCGGGVGGGGVHVCACACVCARVCVCVLLLYHSVGL